MHGLAVLFHPYLSVGLCHVKSRQTSFVVAHDDGDPSLWGEYGEVRFPTHARGFVDVLQLDGRGLWIKLLGPQGREYSGQSFGLEDLGSRLPGRSGGYELGQFL